MWVEYNFTVDTFLSVTGFYYRHFMGRVVKVKGYWDCVLIWNCITITQVGNM